MPYITKFRREFIEDLLRPLLSDMTERINPQYGAGDLAYVLTEIVLAFLNRREIHYEDYALVIGIIGTVEKELFRRMIAPYEDKKRKDNGEVFYETHKRRST